MRRVRRALVLGAAVLALGSTGASGATSTGRPSTTRTTMRTTTGPTVTTRPARSLDELSITESGGLAGPGASFGRMPLVHVVGGARYEAVSDDMARMVPTLLVRRLDASQLAVIVDGALQAGLLNDPPDYGIAGATDLPIMRIELTIGGLASEHEIYGMGVDVALTPAQKVARARLRQFLDLLGTAAAGATAPSSPYVPARYRVQPRPITTVPATAVVRAWPRPRTLHAGAACIGFVGAEARTLTKAFDRLPASTLWRDSGKVYAVDVRPLLPGEPMCE